jgi:hypothetical protein
MTTAIITRGDGQPYIDHDPNPPAPKPMKTYNADRELADEYIADVERGEAIGRAIKYTFIALISPFALILLILKHINEVMMLVFGTAVLAFIGLIIYLTMQIGA